MKTTTVVVNNTSGVLKVKVGDQKHNTEVTSIDKGGRWDLQVDVNETYREFRIQDPSGTIAAIVSSDDCCDHECITIKEAAADANGQSKSGGKFEVHRVPRRSQNGSHGQLPVPAISRWGLQSRSTLTWFGWLRQLWARK